VDRRVAVFDGVTIGFLMQTVGNRTPRNSGAAQRA
jgi:hypothetical protein